MLWTDKVSFFKGIIELVHLLFLKETFEVNGLKYDILI